MFDKLIVSDEQGAEFKGRSRYFMVSTAVVGVLFVTALVFSLYATDIGLGNDEFELSTMLAPVTPSEPEPPREEPQNRPQQSQTNQPESRAENMLRPEEAPISVPTEISVTPNKNLSRSPGAVINGIDNVGPVGPGSPAKGDGGNGLPVGSGSETASNPPPVETVPPPPPVKERPRTTLISKGVINGTATSLPHPPYPEMARRIGVQGVVNVQVTIDESGKVISAKAIDGHPFLRGEAEKAAWKAKFSTTYLSEVPVKVTGVIIYNFKR